MTGHPWQWFGGRTYAQHGEDVILLSIFKQLRIEKPSYLDIGAHHPVVISNTALLYERGSRGINVDANSDLIESFQKVRPLDVNLAVGVGSQKGRRKFYMPGKRSGRSSFVREEAVGHGDLIEMDVEVTTVNTIVDEHAGGVFPNILLIDTEGMDLEIVVSLDLRKSRPDVVIAESGPSSPVALADAMTAKGFVPVFRAGCNLIFLHASHRGWMFA